MPTPPNHSSRAVLLTMGSQIISAGFGTSCSVQREGIVWCWGSVQLQPNSAAMQNVPVPVYPPADPPAFVDVSSGLDTACGILSNSSLACFGSESITSLLNPDDDSPLNGTLWKDISVASEHACGIENSGDAVCWGLCTNSECGPSSTAGQQGGYNRIPDTNPSGGGWGQIDTSLLEPGVTNLASHTCAVKLDGSAWCWGDNTFGQLGYGSKESSATPKAVLGEYSWKQVCTGQGFSCGVTVDGALYCWGLKIPNAEFDKTENIYEIYGTEPTLVDPLQGSTSLLWDSVTCGTNHACVVESIDKTGYCWGNNQSGELGDGSLVESTKPVLVQEGPDSLTTMTWSQLSAGHLYTCGIRDSNNQVYCWGSNQGGQLGVGDSPLQAVPRPTLVQFVAPPLPPPPPPLPPPPPSPVVVLASPPPPIPVEAQNAPVSAPKAAESSSTNVGAIAGGVVGGIVVLALIGVLIWYFMKRSKNKKESKTKEGEDEMAVQDDDNPVPESSEHDASRSDEFVDLEQPAAAAVVVADLQQAMSDDTPLPESSDYYDGRVDEPVGLVQPPAAAAVLSDMQPEKEEEETHNDDPSEVEYFDSFNPVSSSVSKFDTVIIRDKLDLERSQEFLSLYQLTQHFERSTKSASRKGSSTYSSWFNPTKNLSIEDLPVVVKDAIETDEGTMLTEYEQFLKVYSGKITGLQETCRALDQWPTQKKTKPLSKSCQSLLHLIQ